MDRGTNEMGQSVTQGTGPSHTGGPQSPEGNQKGEQGTQGSFWLEMLSASELSHGTTPPGPASFIPGTPEVLSLGQLCPLSDNSPQPENANVLITKPSSQLCPPPPDPSLWLPGLAQYLCYPEFPRSQARNQPNKSR